MGKISGWHHLTLSTDGVQEDYDFYTKTLGLHSVKSTVLFDGVLPVYHLYYGAKSGDASTIITSFPFRKPAVYGRRGSNQTKIIMQAIPVGAADFWVNRLNGRGIPATKFTRFGLDRVQFAHPCGIPHELVENDGDNRAPITNAAQGIGREHGIKGIYGTVVSVMDRTAMDEFLTIALPLKKVADSHEGLAFEVPNAAGPASRVEVLHEPNLPQGTWTLAGGTIHRVALNTGNEENQMSLRAHIEGLGFTDISEQKDRLYFKSFCSEMSVARCLNWPGPCLAAGHSTSLPMPSGRPWFSRRGLPTARTR